MGHRLTLVTEIIKKIRANWVEERRRRKRRKSCSVCPASAVCLVTGSVEFKRRLKCCGACGALFIGDTGKIPTIINCEVFEPEMRMCGCCHENYEKNVEGTRENLKRIIAMLDEKTAKEDMK